ncbi:hypothetical protein RQP46_007438 [Phenoliferia psychrophenolica]
MVARELAPHGGLKSANLRLVCRYLDVVVGPITLASIHLPTTASRLDEFCVAMQAGPDGKTHLVTSLRIDQTEGYRTMQAYGRLPAFTSLRRLHLVGTADDKLIMDFAVNHLKIDWKNIISLRMENTIDCDLGPLHKWAPSIKTLDLVGFDHRMSSSLFATNGVLVPHPRIHNLNIEFPEPNFDLVPAIMAILGSPNARAITLHDVGLRWHSNNEGESSAELMRPLSKLTLPVTRTSIADSDTWANLSFPNVKILVLEVEPSLLDPPYEMDHYFAHASKCKQLLISFPSLTALYLQT